MNKKRIGAYTAAFAATALVGPGVYDWLTHKQSEKYTIVDNTTPASPTCESTQLCNAPEIFAGKQVIFIHDKEAKRPYAEDKPPVLNTPEEIVWVNTEKPEEPSLPYQEVAIDDGVTGGEKFVHMDHFFNGPSFGYPVVFYPSQPPITPPVTPPVTPSVPEPSTWAMMIAGMGLVGAAMRRQKQNNFEPA